MLVRSLYFLAVLVAGVRSAQFVGCLNSSPSDPEGTVSSNPYTSCNTICMNFKYSFTQTPANSGDSVSCACGNSLPSSSANYDTSTGQMCNVGDYAIQDLDSDYAFQQCYVKSGGVDSTWDSREPSECFAHCKTTHNSYAFTSQTEAGAWQCGCADAAPTSNPSTTCGGHNNYASYYHDVHAAEPSHDPQHKRKLKARLAAKKRTLVDVLCPKSMTACRVEGVDSYECLDTKSELESCGGCMFGIYTTAKTASIPKTAAKGEDCTSLRGIPMGAVTCTVGQCTASACKKGWLLESGRCVQAGRKAKRSK